MKTHDGESNPVRLGKMTVYGVEILSGWPATRKQSTWTCSRLGRWRSIGNSRAAKEIFESWVDPGRQAPLINIPLGDELCDFGSQVEGVWAKAFTERVKKLKEVRAKIGLV